MLVGNNLLDIQGSTPWGWGLGRHVAQRAGVHKPELREMHDRFLFVLNPR
jgi:hypothetical protein